MKGSLLLCRHSVYGRAYMGTQVWIRNPRLCIREVVAAGAPLTSWDEGYLKKKKTDVHKFLGIYYPEGIEWQALVIGWSGARLIDADHDLDNPLAIHTVYSAEHHAVNELERMTSKIADEDYKSWLVVTDLPPVHMSEGKVLIERLNDLTEMHPDLKIFFHGTYSFTAMFNNEWYAADFDPRQGARAGKIHLPNGKLLYPLKKPEEVREYIQWINLLGFRASELSEPRDRCIYNIHSAVWAGKHWERNFKFKTRGERADVDAPDDEVDLPTTNRFKRTRHTFGDYDKLLCNTCTVQSSCKFFRMGSVCSVPGAEPAKLAEYFNTRDADRIIKGLGTVLAAQSNRAEEAMEQEAVTGDLSPEVTKILNSLFSNGVKLAKLVNPQLNGKGVSVGVQINGAGSAHIAASDSASQLTASIVATLESKGIQREDITPGMIATVLSEVESGNEILELEPGDGS